MTENTNSQESSGGSVPSPDSSQTHFFGEELPDLPESGPLQDFDQLEIPAAPVIPANTTPANRPGSSATAFEPEDASPPTSRKIIAIVAGCSALAVLLIGAAIFFLPGFLHHRSVQQATQDEDWATLLSYEPDNMEALTQMAASHLESSVKSGLDYASSDMDSDLKKSFEYLERAAALGADSELHQTTLVNAYAKRIRTGLSVEISEAEWKAKLDDLKNAESVGIRTESLGSSKSSLARIAFRRAKAMASDRSRMKNATRGVDAAIQWLSEFRRASNFDELIAKDEFIQAIDFVSRLNELLESPESKTAQECQNLYFGGQDTSTDYSYLKKFGVRDPQYQSLGRYFEERLIRAAAVFCKKGDAATALNAFNVVADVAGETLGANIEDEIIDQIFEGLSSAFADRSSDKVVLTRTIYLRLKRLDPTRANETVARIVDQLDSPQDIHTFYKKIEFGEARRILMKWYDDNQRDPVYVQDVSGIPSSIRWVGVHGCKVLLNWEPTSGNAPLNDSALSFPVGATENRLVLRLPEDIKKNLARWLATLPDPNGVATDSLSTEDEAETPVRYDKCAKLYFGGVIGENSYAQDKRSLLFVQRLVAVALPSQYPSSEAGRIAYEGRIFTSDREEKIQIHDIELGKTVIESGHPARKVLSYKTSIRQRPEAWRRSYLRQLATADIDTLLRESNEAAKVTAEAMTAGPLSRQKDASNLSDAQKQNIQLGKDVLTAVNSLCSGTESWTGAVDEYRGAYTRLVKRFKSVTPLLEGPFEQQLLSLQTPSKIAIVSLADVVPKANEAVKSTDSQITSSVGNRQFWSNTALDDMIVQSEDVTGFADIAQNRAKVEDAKRASKIASSGSGNGKYPKIDYKKPFIYSVIVPGGFRTQDFNQVKVTVFNGTGGVINVATKVNCNLYGDLFVDAFTLNIPPSSQKTTSAHYSTKSTGGLMHKDAWEKRDYQVSCDVEGLENKNVQMFYVVPDDVLHRFSTVKDSSHLIPLSELDRQSKEGMKELQRTGRLP